MTAEFLRAYLRSELLMLVYGMREAQFWGRSRTMTLWILDF